MKREDLQVLLGNTFEGLTGPEAPGLPLYKGKVRDIVGLRDKLLIVASDRISAFDRVLSTIPLKGEILNRISRFWFDATRDIVPNHIIEDRRLSGKRGARVVLAAKAEMLPVEVVVRGYLTGSAWRDYSAGRPISGHSLPSGLKMNDKFPSPLITPSTKESSGHDRPVSPGEIVKTKLVHKELWAEVERAALALFGRGTEIAAKSGLILVDTKYEFGIREGKLILCDEIHTPDSSRFWYSENYSELFAKGEKQKELDKEYFRRWLMDRGFSGDGMAPEITDEVRIETAMRYITAFEILTGSEFIPMSRPAEEEKAFLRELISNLR